MKRVTADQAAKIVQSGDTLLIGGSGGGHAVPEALIAALERRFLAEREPQHHLAASGRHRQRRADQPSRPCWAAEARDLRHLHQLAADFRSCAGRENRRLHAAAGRAVATDARDGGGAARADHADRAFYFCRSAARGRSAKPVRHGGPRRTRRDARRGAAVFQALHVDVCFLRGTTADEDGNVTMEHEAYFGEMLSQAQATRRCGGVVIVQVKRVAQRGTLPPKLVKIPGILVDLVVVEPEQWQTYATFHSPAYAGELRIPLSDIPALPLDARKVIARRAALELFAGAVCNLGSGVSTGIADVAAEEEILDDICLTNEQGMIGGAPASGNEAGAARNYSAMVDQPYQFDFYDGGGLDLAFLSFAEADAGGSVNVSRFGGRIVGPGGFINISQHAKCVVFGGTFTAGKLEMSWPGGETRILRDGGTAKFVAAVEQITYSGPFGRRRGQRVLYVTERAVFRLAEQGVELIEIAPGIDLGRDILARMGFAPAISPDLRPMDARIFLPGKMSLKSVLKSKPAKPRSARLERLEEFERGCRMSVAHVCLERLPLTLRRA